MAPRSHSKSEEARRPAPPEPLAGDDRRAKPRYYANVHVTMESEHNFYVGLSENLSEGGLFLGTHRLLPIGTRLELTFTLPTSSTVLSAVGIVRWVRVPDAGREDRPDYASGDEPPSNPGMGIQFQELDAETALAISRFAHYREPEFFDT
jgi:uncharacterized protein (TIGR02266 family)